MHDRSYQSGKMTGSFRPSFWVPAGLAGDHIKAKSREIITVNRLQRRAAPKVSHSRPCTPIRGGVSRPIDNLFWNSSSYLVVR
jgi:hypothetical protein